jgi:uncharacterized repeat protein (TIGR01451 family)
MSTRLQARGSPIRWAAWMMAFVALLVLGTVGAGAEDCSRDPELHFPPSGSTIGDTEIVQEVTPTSVCAGGEILITVTVDNMTCGAAGAFDLNAYYDAYDGAHFIGTYRVGGLAGCTTLVHQFTWNTTGVPPGPHTVLVWADVLNEVDESEWPDGESNNQYQLPVEVMVYPYAPWIEATKTYTDLDGGKVYPGDTIRYTIVIHNEGCADQEDNPGHEFTDVLPDSVAATGTASASAGSAALDGNTLTWDGAITAGGSVTITVEAKVDPDAEDGQVICNQGTVFWDSSANGSNDAEEPTDDPETPADDDPTCFTVVVPVDPAAAGTIDAPTLSEWAQILLGVLMTAAFIGMLFRRRHAAV